MDCGTHVEAYIVSEPIPGSFGADAVAHLEGNDLSTFDDDGHDSNVADEASRRLEESRPRGRDRCRWSEARLLSLLQTAGHFQYSSIRFNGENLCHGLKGKTMISIRDALEQDKRLWAQIPVPHTLDAWLDAAVADYIKRRGLHGNKSNTGEGDNPETGELASKYELQEIEMELCAYVRVGMEKKAEIELAEHGAREDQERANAMMDLAMGNASQASSMRRTSPAASSRSKRMRREPSMSAVGDSAHERDDDSEGEEGLGVTARARKQDVTERKISDALDAMKALVARQTIREDELHAHAIEVENEKREARREKLAVERERVAAEREKADADKKLMSQLVHIMQTQTCMLNQMLGRQGLADAQSSSRDN